MKDLRLFALSEARPFGVDVASGLGMPLSPHEEREFEDGEHKTRPLVNVRESDVYVVQSLYGEPGRSANDKLVRLLFFIGALKNAGAHRVTAVAPYLCYSRKDRRSKPRDPVSTRYVAQLLEAAGADRVVTLDVHNQAAYENAFRIPAEHLEARRLFVDHFAALAGTDEIAVVSPDIGGVKRAEAFRDALAARLARPVRSVFLEKYRSAGVVSGSAVVGDVKGTAAIVVDDLIASGGTIARAVAACAARGAKAVYAAASHGMFSAAANALVADPHLRQIAVTDTVPPFRLSPCLVREKMVTLSVAPLFAAAIRRMHEGGSIVDLLDRGLDPGQVLSSAGA